MWSIINMLRFYLLPLRERPNVAMLPLAHWHSASERILGRPSSIADPQAQAPLLNASIGDLMVIIDAFSCATPTG